MAETERQAGAFRATPRARADRVPLSRRSAG